jgi:hypothetical protein
LSAAARSFLKLFFIPARLEPLRLAKRRYWDQDDPIGFCDNMPTAGSFQNRDSDARLSRQAHYAARAKGR